MTDSVSSRRGRRSTQRASARLEVACVVAVLLAVALLLTFVALNWSTGSSRFLG